MIDRSQHRRGEAGFSMIELLVVLLIIGVLASLAIPSFLGMSSRAGNAAAKSDVRNMATYHTNLESDGTYATQLSQLAAAGFSGSDDVSHAICADVNFGFAVAAHYAASDSVWLIDYQGRLTESAGTDALSAVSNLPECLAGSNPADAG